MCAQNCHEDVDPMKRYHKSCTTLNGHFGLMIDYDSIFQLVDCGGKKGRPVHPEKGLGQI